jgi:hypothetical protein
VLIKNSSNLKNKFEEKRKKNQNLPYQTPRSLQIIPKRITKPSKFNPQRKLSPKKATPPVLIKKPTKLKKETINTFNPSYCITKEH